MKHTIKARGYRGLGAIGGGAEGIGGRGDRYTSKQGIGQNRRKIQHSLIYTGFCIDKQTDGQTDRQTETVTVTDREIDRQTGRLTD